MKIEEKATVRCKPILGGTVGELAVECETEKLQELPVADSPNHACTAINAMIAIPKTTKSAIMRPSFQLYVVPPHYSR